MNIKMKFGIRIRDLRKIAGLSQEKLALKAGIDRTYMQAIEAGRTNASLEIIEKLSKALEISLTNIFIEL